MTFISSDNSILIQELTSCRFDFTTEALMTVLTENSSTVTLTGDGTAASRLSAAVKISTTAGNLLTVNGTGLFVNPASIPTPTPIVKVSATDATANYLEDKFQGGTNITINKITTLGGEKLVINSTAGSAILEYADTSTIDFGGSGIVGDPLTAAVKLSTTPGNALIANSTGLYVPTPSYSGESVLVTTDSSSLAFSTSGTAGHSLTGSVKISNSVGNILTISGNGLYVPTPTITQDTLVATDTDSINFTTSGAAGHNITADVKVSPDSGNNLQIRPNGLFVNPSSANTPITIVASPGISILTSGTDLHTLTPSLEISANSGNQLSILSDGLYVPIPTIAQEAFVAVDTNTINFTTTGTLGHTLTGDVKISADSGNSLESRSNGLFVPTASANTPITVLPSASISIVTSGTDSHTLQPDLLLSATVGNQATILSDGLYVPESSSASGTVNYVSKFTSTTGLGNSQIYDNGTRVVIGGTTGSSLFNVIGQTSLTNTTTHTSGTATAMGVLANTTFSGGLPSSNASFSSMIGSMNSIFNGNTTVAGDTPFGSILAVATINFSSTGTVTMNNGTGGGLKAVSALNVANFDNGTINGTVTKTAGLQINGIFKVVGSTGTITRTNHYQLLINSTDEYGDAGGVGTAYGIYQAGTADINVFNGAFRLPNLPVYADNTAASSLATGTLYRTSTGVVMVKY